MFTFYFMGFLLILNAKLTHHTKMLKSIGRGLHNHEN